MPNPIKELKKVAITGPESTGKSILTGQLAKYYHAGFAEEYARKYLENNPQIYVENDLLVIARGQLEALLQAETGNSLVFCDTEMLVMKIWSEYKYGRCHPYILEMLQQQDFDLYLLCDIDLPWEYDPQRENPTLRKFFFDWYETELIRLGFNYRIVNGTGEQRLQNAITTVDEILKINSPNPGIVL